VSILHTAGSKSISSLHRTPSKFSDRYIARHRKKYGAHPWVESPNTPDGPDLLDAGDGVEGVGGGWPGVGSVECVGLFVGFRDLLSADEQGKKEK
jgi:hypothetical protein